MRRVMSSYAAAGRTVSAASGSSSPTFGGSFETCQYVVASTVGPASASAGVTSVISTSCASMIRWQTRPLTSRPAQPDGCVESLSQRSATAARDAAQEGAKRSTPARWFKTLTLRRERAFIGPPVEGGTSEKICVTCAGACRRFCSGGCGGDVCRVRVRVRRRPGQVTERRADHPADQCRPGTVSPAATGTPPTPSSVPTGVSWPSCRPPPTWGRPPTCGTASTTGPVR